MGRLRRAVCSECQQDLKGGKCRGVGEAKERERPLPSGAFGRLWPSLPAPKVGAEVTGYGVEGVNLVKLHGCPSGWTRTQCPGGKGRERSCL